VRADDLAAFTIRELVARTKVDPERIDDVFWGAANQAGEDNRNVARMAALLAGCRSRFPGTTVTRLCASGLQAMNSAAQAIASGCGDIMIAGGVESMTRAPYVMPKADKRTTVRRRCSIRRSAAHDQPEHAGRVHDLDGETAENVAEKYGITARGARRVRARLAAKDESRGRNVARSMPRSCAAAARRDEHPRPQTTIADLAKLKPAFKKNGTVTAGNSSGVNDGAAALLLCTADVAAKNGLAAAGARRDVRPLPGVDPAFMGLGPIPATQKALARAGLTIGDLDLYEINEAFASQSIACMRESEDGSGEGQRQRRRDCARASPRLQRCAFGRHVLHELRRRNGRFALATMCIGVGQGIATIFERCSGARAETIWQPSGGVPCAFLH